ncbi:acyltransferase family protein [Clostridium perfringens]|nr:acyltransferase family protein [Clostridium perfringens]
MNKSRNINYDILKVIALFGIMLAHIGPNKVVFQLRNFDVPMMIIISVWLSLSIYNKDNFNYKIYLLKRIKRLVKPTWIFLTIYFLFYWIFKGSISIKTIILSYTLINGIGYVWIIRIYIYVAIITPIYSYIYNNLKIFSIIIIILIEYLIYAFLIKFSFIVNERIRLFLTISILDFVGYSFVVWIAILTYKLSIRNRFLVSIFSAILFIFLAVKYNFIPTQEFKYPIRLYYLSYAFSIIFMLDFFVEWIDNKYSIKKSKIIIYISSNSMWIYLWHILYIPLVNKFFVNLQFGYIIRFIVIAFLAIITTSLQNLFYYKFKKINNIKRSYLCNNRRVN